MGAVATTFVAGVEAVRKGVAKPIGSLTQMGTIRLGKRTDNNSPAVRDFVPLAALKDLVFTGWDIFEDDMYTAATKAGVLERDLLQQIKPFLSSIKPRKAVFDRNYVRKLDGRNVKEGKNKMDLAEQVRADIREFKKSSGAERLITIWCGSTEIFLEPTAVHGNVKTFEKGLAKNDENIAPSMWCSRVSVSTLDRIICVACCKTATSRTLGWTGVTGNVPFTESAHYSRGHVLLTLSDHLAPRN